MLKSPSYFVRSIYLLELSLIELLLAILIIAITVTISIPHIYTTLYRSQIITEAITLISAVRNETAIYHAQQGQLPTETKQLATFKTEGRYTDSIHLQQGVVIAQMKPETLPKNLTKPIQLTFQAALSNDSAVPFLTWQCGIDNSVTNPYLPHYCR
jgi:type II secretory pathway pseudopilin PulG